MPLSDAVRRELEREEPTQFHDSLLQHCKRLLDLSRAEMRKYYDDWDAQDDTYQGTVAADKEDLKAASRKEPIKAAMPVTRSQVDTFAAFGFSLFFQRETFFELLPFGSDNVKAAATGEALLQRDLDYSNIHLRVFQFLLDIGRFGLGVLKNSWVEKTQVVKEFVQPPPGEILGEVVQGEPIEQEVTVVKYQGNELSSVSPYRFFPDPRYPISELQKGEFVASEDEVGVVELRSAQADGMVAGIEHLREMNARDSAGRRESGRTRFARISDTFGQGKPVGDAGTVLRTEIIVRLIPSEWMMEDGSPLGSETRPVRYLVWYANDDRIIRVEPYEHAHDEFPYFAAQLTPDMHHLVSQGLSGVLAQLQSIISWFINSHIASVRRVIQNRLVVDPQKLRMEDIIEKLPVIRTVPGASRSGFDSVIKQLDMQDVTSGHVDDATRLHELVQLASGLSDNALGQFHGGRRSAQEARTVSSSVAGRMKMVFTTIYYQGLEPAGRQMLSNLREGLSLDVFVRLFGVASDPTKYFDFAKVSKLDLVGDYDFEIFDGTLPSEKGVMAQSLQEVLMTILSSPDLLLVLGLDVREMFFELMRLRGLRHPERFMIGFDQQVLLAKMLGSMQQQQQTQQQPQNGQPSVQPGDNRAPATAPGGVDRTSLLQILQGVSGAGGAGGVR